jgi:hypothetical protein
VKWFWAAVYSHRLMPFGVVTTECFHTLQNMANVSRLKIRHPAHSRYAVIFHGGV